MRYEKDIIREAKHLQRLMTRRRALLRELRKVNADIRTQKKHFRAVVASIEDWQQSGAESKVIGNRAGE